MKNSSSLKAKNNNESPKTPGGISKSLLTPCRRVGLSRNWRKTGPSPFISPLSNACNINEDIKQESKPRKRKKLSQEKEIEDSENTDDNNGGFSNAPLLLPLISINEATNTPKRSVSLRKKSKSLHLVKESLNDEINIDKNGPEGEVIESPQLLSTKREKSMSRLPSEPTQSVTNSQSSDISEKSLDRNDIHFVESEKKIASSTAKLSVTKQISPNNLSKECIVVIQNKIKSSILNNLSNLKNAHYVTSQGLFDSDSDDVPLCELNKQNHNLTNNKSQVTNSDLKEEKVFVKTLDNKNTSTGDLDFVQKPKQKLSTKKRKNSNSKEDKLLYLSPNSFDDNDDDEFDTKRTILIKKTYNKITKPVKAKSTGSITDQDIDELRARIEVKKQLFLAKALTPETQELRGLIKKWQKGCQDALMELIDLMKKRMPEQNVDNSQILQMLKIPPSLVGYDSDNDCFNTPNDENVVLASLNNL